MKKKYSFINALLLCVVISSCTSTSNNNDEWVLTSDTTYRWEAYEWKLSGCMDYEYNRDGDLIYEKRKYLSPEGWESGSFSSMYYDNKGLRTSSTSKWGNNPSDSTTYTYNEKDLLVLQTQYSFYWPDSTMRISNKDSSMYNDDGLLVKRISQRLSHGPKGITTTTFFYDSVGSLIKETVDYSQQMMQLDSTTWLSYYDSTGKVKAKEYHVYKKDKDESTHRELYQYDSLTNLIKRKSMINYGDHYVNYILDYFEYDDNNNQIVSGSQRWINGLWVDQYKRIKVYKRK